MSTLNRRLIKAILSIALLFFAIMVFYHGRYHVTEGPYFFRRLARLHYGLDPNPALQHRGGKWTSVLWANDHPGGDITDVSTAVAGGAAYLAVFSFVLGIPLNATPYIPVIPIGAFFTSYLLLSELTNRRVGLAGASIILVSTSSLAHFHEYRFGRMAILPLYLYFVARLMRVRRTKDVRFPALGLLISQLTLKLTGPSTEVVAVNALIFVGMAALIFWDGRTTTAQPLLIFAAISGAIYFLANPKFYYGVVAGLVGAQTAVSLGEGNTVLEQFISTFMNIKQMFVGAPSGGSKYGYNATRPFISNVLSKISTLSLLGIVGVYGLHQLLKSLKTRYWSRQFMLVAGAFCGIGMTFIFRAALLGRYGAKGLATILPIAGLVAVVNYGREHHALLLALFIVVISSIGIGVDVHASPGKPYRSESADELAGWHSRYVPVESKQLMDYHLWGNIAYYYNEYGVSKYWDKYPMTSWNGTRYEALITGHPDQLQADYLVVAWGYSEYSVKPRSYATYPPLGREMDMIVSDRGYQKVYSNGYHAQYTV